MSAQASLRWVPRDDTFGARLALVRQRFGWNLKEASLACGLPQNSWLEWESNGRVPRDLAEVVERISRRTGADDYWLLTGKTVGDPPSGPPESPLPDSNRRVSLYIVDGSGGYEWPLEANKVKDAA